MGLKLRGLGRGKQHPTALQHRAMSSEHPITDLHNLAGIRRMRLDYEEASSGPPSSPMWTITAFYGVEYGRGVASTKLEAKRIAARNALQLLLSTLKR
ncbi:hypothetical protein AMATHDRAFT_6433 [Amanita thiersii Skay4041]|uniref:DRBM domain-containing protein n=1 Tax=Amanita thiersii Skay4041 TaxID=703135 RepID=A0A2A9N9T9_9AGAR|nr:hypothetical protein AMATHDRAFT_6433 [Amanita thiersii Skay4041]